MSSSEAFVSVPALRVVQPFGELFLTRLSAAALLRVAYSDPLRAEPSEKSNYVLTGTQRQERADRLREIAAFIDTTEATFPSSIVLAANYAPGGVIEEDPDLRWRVERTDGDLYLLTIPTPKPLASIVDGQHRLRGFTQAHVDPENFYLPVSLFIDLPNPFQAYVFATINFNQKKVDRSLALELFGFDTDDELPIAWTPDKTAVFLARKLNTDEQSPLFRRIRIAPLDEKGLLEPLAGWKVSMAAVVQGLLQLISSAPQRDRYLLLAVPLKAGRSRALLNDDAAPLRAAYLQSNDLLVYTIVRNFFLAAETTLFSKEGEASYITKTVGIQALFDVLRRLAPECLSAKNVKVEYFVRRIEPATKIDFADNFFQASGKGRVRIRNAILLATGLITETDLPNADLNDYHRLVAN